MFGRTISWICARIGAEPCQDLSRSDLDIGRNEYEQRPEEPFSSRRSHAIERAWVHAKLDEAGTSPKGHDPYYSKQTAV
jgi:hypothetical protein